MIVLMATAWLLWIMVSVLLHQYPGLALVYNLSTERARNYKKGKKPPTPRDIVSVDALHMRDSSHIQEQEKRFSHEIHAAAGTPRLIDPSNRCGAAE